MQLINTNNSAFLGDMIPLGISRDFVLGFFKSISLSIYLLNAMAAFLPVTIHKMTSINFSQENEYSGFEIANVKPSKAKGNANTV